MRLILSPSRSGGGQSRVGQWTTGGTGRVVGHRSREKGIGLQRRQQRRLDDVNAPRAELYPPVFDAPDVKLGLLHLPAINVRLVAASRGRDRPSQLITCGLTLSTLAGDTTHPLGTSAVRVIIAGAHVGRVVALLIADEVAIVPMAVRRDRANNAKACS